MKNLYFIVFILTSIIFSSCKTAYIYECDCTDKSFKIKYDYPSKKAGMSDKEYDSQINMLENIYDDYRYKQKFPEKRKEFSYAVPWNLALVYARLEEPKEKILCLLCKEEERSIEVLARKFKDYDIETNPFNLTKSEVDSLIKRYQPYYDQIPAEQTSSGPTIWAKDRLDHKLAQLMNSLVDLDQKYRSDGNDYYMENIELQSQIDSTNMLKIDLLYKQYGTYIGRSLVGESKEYAMWAVIQHAPLERQEYYLPIVQKAVEDFELKEAPFKMLVDRVYYKKYGYQIFGSQKGKELGSKTQIKKAKKKFNLNE